LRKPSNDFGVLRHGKPIEEATIWSDIEVRTGIAYKRQIANCIPFYEEFDAMVKENYNEEAWMKLPPKERAMAVAHYRLNKFILLHEGDAIEMKRRAKPHPR
jgi:hypothetical protein